MNGREVFRHAVQKISGVIEEVMTAAEVAKAVTLEAVMVADSAARSLARERIAIRALKPSIRSAAE